MERGYIYIPRNAAVHLSPSLTKPPIVLKGAGVCLKITVNQKEIHPLDQNGQIFWLRATMNFKI